MTELERRIEDGVNYDHMLNPVHQRRPSPTDVQGSPVEDLPSARGVFCGYRVTSEEFDRLRSAAPDE
jgi:hypothetical protein